MPGLADCTGTMKFHHRILSYLYPFLKLKDFIANALSGNGNCLRVLLYHDIAAHEVDNFSHQLEWLQRSWNFVSPSEFAGMVTGDLPISGRNLLLTFDDGFSSNLIVAKNVLAKLGIKAIFFVVSDFVSISDRDSSRNFISTNIYPQMETEAVPNHWSNMNWQDLDFLLQNGHTIGCHTLSHAKLSEITDEDALCAEIIDSADCLERRLGVTIDHFAYTFGDIASFSPAAMKIAQRRFKFVYSGLRGDNSSDCSSFALRRDALSASDPLSLVGSFLLGGSDFRYRRSRSLLDLWSR